MGTCTTKCLNYTKQIIQLCEELEKLKMKMEELEYKLTIKNN